MPLCSVPRRRQADTSVEEHQNSSSLIMGCGKVERTKFIMPDDMKIHLRTRAGVSVKKKGSKKRACASVPSPSQPAKREMLKLAPFVIIIIKKYSISNQHK